MFCWVKLFYFWSLQLWVGAPIHLVYVCMYVCICMYTCSHTYIYIHIYVSEYMHCIYIPSYMHACLVYMHMHVCGSVHTYIYLTHIICIQICIYPSHTQTWYYCNTVHWVILVLVTTCDSCSTSSISKLMLCVFSMSCSSFSFNISWCMCSRSGIVAWNWCKPLSPVPSSLLFACTCYTPQKCRLSRFKFLIAWSC